MMVAEPGRKTILIVDDDRNFVDALKIELEAANYNVVATTVPAEGVRLTRSTRPDLVITDVIMPMVDGFSLCKNIKVSETTMHIPVILTSGKRLDEADRLKGRNVGADAYILKPLDFRELLRHVRRLLQARDAGGESPAQP